MFYAFIPYAVPFIAALQRYAVAYGYEGKTRLQSWHEAKGVFVLLGLIVVAIMLWGHL